MADHDDGRQLHRLPAPGHGAADPARSRCGREVGDARRGRADRLRQESEMAAALRRRLRRSGRVDHGRLGFRHHSASGRACVQSGRTASDGRPHRRVRRHRRRLFDVDRPHEPRRTIRRDHHLGDGDPAEHRLHRGQPGLELLFQHRLVDRSGRHRRLHHRSAHRTEHGAQGSAPRIRERFGERPGPRIPSTRQPLRGRLGDVR